MNSPRQLSLLIFSVLFALTPFAPLAHADDDQAPDVKSHFGASGALGVAVVSNSGAGVAIQTGVSSTTTASDGSNRGWDAKADLVAGSTDPSADGLPVLNIEARKLWGYRGDALKLSGSPESQFYIKGAFDRSTPMDRLWGVSAAGGLTEKWKFDHTKSSTELGLDASARLGVGHSGSISVLPYLIGALGGHVEETFKLDSAGKHEIALRARAEAQAGLVQVGLLAGADAQYRYKIEDNQGDKTILYAGPTGNAQVNVDLAGVHNAGTFLFTVGVAK
jgi:hypothetical protein